ncbi:5'-3' exonuclease [Staphylococcus aureus]|nr:5'-3' exonuclease [Staphylococcus aureus]
MPNKILLVDGMALLFRHFYATSLHKQFMYNSQGVPTNGIQGFVRHIFSAIHEIRPTHVAVCWDMGQSTFRNDMFDGYKQNRSAPPEELIPQFDYVKEISEQFGFVNIGVKNYEADDVIGTLAQQLIDIKAFMGDTADGYAGVKGIGEKTAIKLIQQYQSVENVVENIDALSAGQRNKINDNLDELYLSKRLAEIHTQVPIDSESLFEKMSFATTLNHILSICNEHELHVSGKYISSHF